MGPNVHQRPPFIFCPLVARLHVPLARRRPPSRLPLKLLPLCSTTAGLPKPQRAFCSASFFWIAVCWKRALRINRPVAHLADFPVKYDLWQDLWSQKRLVGWNAVKETLFSAIRAPSVEEAVRTVRCYRDARGCLVSQDSMWRWNV
jgi:hypothetical protein